MSRICVSKVAVAGKSSPIKKMAVHVICKEGGSGMSSN